MANKVLNTYDEEKELKLKERLTELSGLQSKFVNYLKVMIDTKEYVHVVVIDNYLIKKKKPKLVLLHGLSGSSMCFFTMFQALSNHFVVYAIDLPGMGLSSHIPYEFLDRDKSEDFFLTRIKAVFSKLHLKKSILLGHSFGGYLAGLFTIKYPDYVTNLVLVSPLGLTPVFKEISNGNMIENLISTLAFKLKKGPNDGMKILGILSYPIFSKYCERTKFKGLNEEEYRVLKEFLYIQILKNNSSDPSVYALFDKNLKAYKPLSFFLDAFKGKKILLSYGENDWCPRENGEEFKKLLGKNMVDIITISNCNHMVQSDNYKELNEKLINYFKGLNVI